jgi:predicted phosphodiesterase
MRYAIFGDIHANLPALEAVLTDAKAMECADMACLGDIVGYHQHPKECVNLIRTLGIPCVKGNVDEYCSSAIPLESFTRHTMESILWTREQLTEDQRRWLRELPLVGKVSGFTIVHGSLDQPERWEYIFDKFGAARHFSEQHTAVCFFGHTHMPVAFIRDSVVRGGTFSTMKIEPKRKYFVNAGSVGQPRDGDRRPSYLIYDLDESVVTLRRVEIATSDNASSR